MGLQALLKEAQGNWAGAAEKAKERHATGGQGEFERLPDGTYEADLTGAVVELSKGSGRLQVAWTYSIAEGPDEGEETKDFRGIADEDGMARLIEQLLKYEDAGHMSGVDSIVLTKLQGQLDKLTKKQPSVQIRLKTKGEYQNCYLEKVYEDGEERGGDGEGGTEPEKEPVKEAEKPARATRGKKAPEPEPAAEPEPEELKIGTKVAVTVKGTEYEGVVTEIDEEAETAEVDYEVNGKTKTADFPAADIVILKTQ